MLPEVSSSCAAACAMAKPSANVVPDGNGADVVLEDLSMSEYPLLLPHSDVLQERCNDPSVKEISECDRVFTRAFNCKRIYPAFYFRKGPKYFFHHWH